MILDLVEEPGWGWRNLLPPWPPDRPLDFQAPPHVLEPARAEIPIPTPELIQRSYGLYEDILSRRPLGVDLRFNGRLIVCEDDTVAKCVYLRVDILDDPEP